MDARSSWAVGLAMNARGAMEIILGVLALRAGLIGERMFVALVVMALFTSLISGPAIQAVMKDKVSSAVEVSAEAAPQGDEKASPVGPPTFQGRGSSRWAS